MKIFSNIFLFIGIMCIVCMIVLYFAGYKDEAFILAGTGIVSTFVADVTYRKHKKLLKKD